MTTFTTTYCHRVLYARTIKRRDKTPVHLQLNQYATWPEFWSHASRHILSCGYRRSTELLYRQILRAFVRYVNKPPAQVTRDDIRAYLRHITENRVTRSWTGMNISVLRTLFDKLAGLNALKSHRGPRPAKSLVEYLDRGDITKLITSAVSLRDQIVISLLYGCGLKPSELNKLTWGDFDPETGCISLVSRYTGKKRSLRVPVALFPILRSGKSQCPSTQLIIPGARVDQPISIRSIQRIVTQAVVESGVTAKFPITANTLRHSFAVHYMEDGGNIRELQETLDHQTLETTMRYEALRPRWKTQNSPIQVEPIGPILAEPTFPILDTRVSYINMLKTHLKGRFLSARRFFQSS